MEDTSKALHIIGILGIAIGILGYIGFFAGGSFGDFMSGAVPGILIGLSVLTFIVA